GLRVAPLSCRAGQGGGAAREAMLRQRWRGADREHQAGGGGGRGGGARGSQFAGDVGKRGEAGGLGGGAGAVSGIADCSKLGIYGEGSGLRRRAPIFYWLFARGQRVMFIKPLLGIVAAVAAAPWAFGAISAATT